MSDHNCVMEADGSGYSLETVAAVAAAPALTATHLAAPPEVVARLVLEAVRATKGWSGRYACPPPMQEVPVDGVGCWWSAKDGCDDLHIPEPSPEPAAPSKTEAALQDSDCADRGHAVTGILTQTCPVIGDIVIAAYPKSLAVESICSLFEIADGA